MGPGLRRVPFWSGGEPRVVKHRRAANRNLARLHRLGHLAHEIDRQQSISQVSASDADKIGKLETAFERARRDSAIEQVALVALAILRFARADRQLALVRADFNLIGFKTSDRERDPITVIAELFDVKGRVISALAAELPLSRKSNSRSKPTVERRYGVQSN